MSMQPQAAALHNKTVALLRQTGSKLEAAYLAQMHNDALTDICRDLDRKERPALEQIAAIPIVPRDPHYPRWIVDEEAAYVLANAELAARLLDVEAWNREKDHTPAIQKLRADRAAAIVQSLTIRRGLFDLKDDIQAFLVEYDSFEQKLQDAFNRGVQEGIRQATETKA